MHNLDKDILIENIKRLMKEHDVCSFSDILLHQKWQTALQLYLHYRLPFS